MLGKRYVLSALVLAWLGLSAPLAAAEPAFKADFEDGKMDGWEPTDANAWKIEDVEGNKVLCLHKRKSDYKPKVRSPFNITWLKEPKFASFVLDLKAQSTVKDYGHRDLCLFFGKQDASHFYYVHMANKADPHAHSIFAVDGKPRVSIVKERTNGVVWGDQWHHLRIIRDAENGSIQVFFDDMEKPIMSTTDKRFVEGQIGVGSFDDTGRFDDLRIYKGTTPPKADGANATK